MEFTFKTDKVLDGEVQYIDTDKAVALSMHERYITEQVVWCLVAETLQLGVRMRDWRLAYLTGYCPIESWRKGSGKISMPEFVAGAIYAKSNLELNAEDTIHTELYASRPTFDDSSGLLLFGEISPSRDYIELAEGFVVGLENSSIQCLILRPTLKLAG